MAVDLKGYQSVFTEDSCESNKASDAVAAVLRPSSSISSETTEEPSQWAGLVDRVRCDDQRAMQELYDVFRRGVRIFFCRQLDMQDVDDKVHDTYVIVVNAIRNGEIRNPDSLLGFVRTVARRIVASHIDTNVRRRRTDVSIETEIAVPVTTVTPEHEAVDREKMDIMLAVLRSMGDRDREVLTRFYLREQSPELICREMDLTETQFRLLKSRAKERFAELGKTKLAKRAFIERFRRKPTLM